MGQAQLETINNQVPFANLQIELMQEIADKVSLKQTFRMRRVCRSWQEAIESDVRWMYRVCFKGSPLPEKCVTLVRLQAVFQSTSWEANPSIELNLSYCNPRKAKRLNQELAKVIPSKVISLRLTHRRFDALPNSIRHLYIQGDAGVTGSHLSKISSSVANLHLEYCPFIRGSHFKEIPANVTSLFLDGCWRLKGKDLTCIPNTVARLFLRGCHQLTGNDLCNLPGTIQQLHLAKCPQLHAEDLKQVPVTIKLVNIGNLKIAKEELKATFKKSGSWLTRKRRIYNAKENLQP